MNFMRYDFIISDVLERGITIFSVRFENSNDLIEWKRHEKLFCVFKT